MNNLITEPIYGDDCQWLTPGVFPVGENPMHLLVTFFDVTPCPLVGDERVPNGSAILTQEIPCQWTGEQSTIGIAWTPAEFTTTLTAGNPGENYFIDVIAAVGSDTFDNSFINCVAPFTFGFAGTGQVLLEAYEANSWELANDFNFLDPAGSYFAEYMLDSASPFTSVTRLSSRRWNTNISIKRER